MNRFGRVQFIPTSTVNHDIVSPIVGALSLLSSFAAPLASIIGSPLFLIGASIPLSYRSARI